MSLLAEPESQAPAAPAAGNPASPAPATPTPATTAAPSGLSAPWTWAAEDGTFSQGWHDKLPDGLKGDPSLAVFQSLPQLAKAYKETKSMVGKRTAPPTDKSTPDEVAAWRALMGAPESPDDYGALKPDDIPDEMWSPEIEAEAKALAHKYHLPPSVLKEFAGLNVKGTKVAYEREIAAAKQALDSGRAKLRAEWGENFDRNKARALAVAGALGIPEDHSIFMDHPDILTKFAAGAQTFLGGDAIVGGAPIGAAGGIDSHIRAIQSSPEYQGKQGADAQRRAQAQLHQLYAAQSAVKKSA